MFGHPHFQWKASSSERAEYHFVKNSFPKRLLVFANGHYLKRLLPYMQMLREKRNIGHWQAFKETTVLFWNASAYSIKVND
jgi:hypothetical protein